MKRAGITPSQAISIGDEVRDIEAARAAGIACGAVMWGYAAPDALRALAPDLAFDRMEDVAGRLTNKGTCLSDEPLPCRSILGYDARHGRASEHASP